MFSSHVSAVIVVEMGEGRECPSQQLFGKGISRQQMEDGLLGLLLDLQTSNAKKIVYHYFSCHTDFFLNFL